MKKTFIALLLFYVTLFPQRAHAYLDPSTGSYIIQIVGAAIFGSLFALKVWWRQITGFISKVFKRKEKK